jgi:Cu(I)/Ag(I) efflux system protein CusF
MKLRTTLALSVATLAFAGIAPAETAAALTEGEVRKIDKPAGRVTLQHGPIQNLEMPGMTMAFRVGNEALLDKVKVGDKVRFRAEKIDGRVTVTQIEPQR